MQVKLLNYFRNYMKEHLLKAGANMEVTFKDWNLKGATCRRLIGNMIHSHPGS